MLNITKNEWRMLFRNRTFGYLTTFFLLSLILVVWIGVVQFEEQQGYRKLAQEHVREQWENLKEMNPHGAAHYGTYAFKPSNLLSSMDGGINDITGNVLQLEGHVQNEIVYSEASQSLSISKFGKLKSSLLLQYVIPLFLIFLSYGSISNEKVTQRIKLLVFQGATLKTLIYAKSLSTWLYGMLLLTLTIIFHVLFIDLGSDTLSRLTLIFLSYGCYYFIISSLAVFLSAKLKSNASALASLLAIWIIWTIFLPKIWGNTVEKIYPLPDRMTFKKAMREERSKGIDGHDPYDKRREDLKNKYLVEYKVDSLNQLPINFDGIVVQEDEEYGNAVWDKHFGNNYTILQKQKFLYQVSGFLNPFSSLQSVSMGFCGTDMNHHLHFLRNAEDYRRYLIKELNDKHAYGGSKTGDWSWKVDSTFFKSVEGFSYQTPEIAGLLYFYHLDMICLILWGLLIPVLIKINTARDMEI